MPPHSTAEADTAVALVLGGMSVQSAWEQSGQPGKTRETGQRNIRSRVKRAREEAEVAAPLPKAAKKPVTPAPLAAVPVPRTNCETAPFRLRTDQIDKKNAAEKLKNRAYVVALKAASVEFEQQQRTGGPNGSKGMSAANVAAKHNEGLPADVKLLKGPRVRDHVAAGRAGLSPPGKGPAPIIPQVVVNSLSSHVSMSQINGNELKPRAIKSIIMALLEGTTLAQYAKSKQQRTKFLKRLRQSGLCAVPKVLCDNRRWMYLTYTNVDRYYDGWKYFLLTEGFGEDETEVQPDGSTAEITISDFMKRRLSNGDETHQRLSNVGDKSGSRATTYINVHVVRSGSRKVVNQKHITSYILVNGWDEVGPYTAIFDSSCDDEADRKLNVGWTAGLPRVICQFGFDEAQTCEPIVLVTPKGGTSEDALEKIVELAIISLYPNLAPYWIKDGDDNIIGGPICHRLDGGPGRTGQASLPFRMRMAGRGVFLFPSGPANCTAALQECDQAFGLYKSVCDEVTDEIVSERIKQRADEESAVRDGKTFTNADGVQSRKKKDMTKVELTNSDLPRIVNGKPSDPIEKRPFSRAFSKEKVPSPQY